MQFFTNRLVITHEQETLEMSKTLTANIQGIKLFIHPVRDIAQAKTLFGKLLSVQPYFDQPYYVGFQVGDQEIGLDPNGHSQGMTEPVGYWQVDDIRKSLQLLLDAGAQTQQEARMSAGGS